MRSRPGLAALFTVAGVAAAAGCGSPSAPSTASVATIRVSNETFRVKLVTPALAQAARSAQAGGPARIPNGRIVAGPDANVGWSWHLEDVVFVETAIETCDGTPSAVERAGTSYGGGRYCPWSATVIGVEP